MIDQSKLATLENRVAEYHAKRTRFWKILWTALSVLLTSSLVCITLIKRHQYHTALARHRQLTQEHKQAAHTWAAYQKAGKRLKALKREQQLIGHTANPADYLEKIAQILPPRTLLTSYSYSNNHYTLKGIADSYHELAALLADLNKDASATLITSEQQAPGVYFEIRC